MLSDRITLQPHLLQTRVVHKALLSKNRGDITLASGKVHNEVVHNVLTFKNPGRGWCTRLRHVGQTQASGLVGLNGSNKLVDLKALLARGSHQAENSKPWPFPSQEHCSASCPTTRTWRTTDHPQAQRRRRAEMRGRCLSAATFHHRFAQVSLNEIW